jgi:phosphopantetheine adenylyltransferase/dephospho-CoA kinase
MQLEKLNGIVWPVLLDYAKEQIQILSDAGYQIVVMEAAILLQAGWDQHVHEVWACIIPPEEVIQQVEAKGVFLK